MAFAFAVATPHPALRGQDARVRGLRVGQASETPGPLVTNINHPRRLPAPLAAAHAQRFVWLDSEKAPLRIRRGRHVRRADNDQEGANVVARKRQDSAACLLVLLNVAVFVYERFSFQGFGGHRLANWRLFNDDRRFRAVQLITSTLCHRDWSHLSANLFGLYVFGRAVEEQSGFTGFVATYIICGVLANIATRFMLPTNVVSEGASGAVFGLFVTATLCKLEWDPRSLIECLVLGQFAISQVMGEFTGPGRVGVNSIAHKAGAVAGVIAYILVKRREVKPQPQRRR